MPTAQRRQAPLDGCVSVLEVEGGLRLFRKNSGGTSWPSPSVIGIARCLLLIDGLRMGLNYRLDIEKYLPEGNDTWYRSRILAI
jgi:hypothetical protein